MLAFGMATIIVRNLPDPVRDRLRDRAARRGVSMEEEARETLTRALAEPEPEGDLGARLHALFADLGGLELDRRDEGEAAAWDIEAGERR